MAELLTCSAGGAQELPDFVVPPYRPTNGEISRVQVGPAPSDSQADTVLAAGPGFATAHRQSRTWRGPAAASRGASGALPKQARVLATQPAPRDFVARQQCSVFPGNPPTAPGTRPGKTPNSNQYRYPATASYGADTRASQFLSPFAFFSHWHPLSARLQRKMTAETCPAERQSLSTSRADARERIRQQPSAVFTSSSV